MSSSPVVIVGAGPSGLALGLSLAKYGINSVILEKEMGVTEDPRGVYLASDATRIVYDLGIGDQMGAVGHEAEKVMFHKTSFQTPAFHIVDITGDVSKHVVPEGFFQVQPRLERALRDQVVKSTFCDLKEGCEVKTCTESSDGLRVGFTDSSGNQQHIDCSWLVGADGKRGIVRKHFLEPKTDIRQTVGLYPYEGTWIAANLKLHLPTPESHPQFPLWAIGFSPEQVYDLYWPRYWRFCSPPGLATACGRFGPHADRFWRHEIAVPGWKDGDDAEAALLEHLLPMVTREADEDGNPFAWGPTPFPRECIEVLRCRPFTFSQKVVNRWFDGRTILIGDAAHVFPPFGGRGISCGIRDADSLAWRLAVLCRSPKEAGSRALMETWAKERRQGIDDATRFTMSHGILCNGEEGLFVWAIRNVIELLKKLPGVGTYVDGKLHDPGRGYKSIQGFFLPGAGGGTNLAQVYIRAPGKEPVLSDTILRRGTTFTLLAVGDVGKGEWAQVLDAIRASNLPSAVLSEESIVQLDPTGTLQHPSPRSPQSWPVYSLVSESEIPDKPLRAGYQEMAYMSRLGRSTRYAIIRPDRILFSAARSAAELASHFASLAKMIADDSLGTA